jgi:two-component system capsular synthesis response regulator RcsB
VGHLQRELPAILSHRQIRPSGLSSIEKRISKMKESLGFSTTEQLIAYCKDIGII